MPRLRKTSAEQRRRAMQQNLANYREQNGEEDRIRNSEMLSLRRENEEYRENQQRRNRNNQNLRRSRQSSELRELARERDSLSHSARRSDTLLRSMEQVRNTLDHSQRRENLEYRGLERERDALAHSSRRSDPLNRAAEQERNSVEHTRRREIPEVRELERERDASAHSSRRSDPLINAAEQARNTEEHIRRREIPELRELERERDALAHSSRRSDPLNRTAEQVRNTAEHSHWRQIPENRETERERDAIAHSLRRSDPLSLEQQSNTILRRESRGTARIQTEDLHNMQNGRIRLHRMNPINRINENTRQAERNINNRQALSPESRVQRLEADSQRHSCRMLQQFNLNIKNGPTEVCVCCGGLWFPNQIKKLCRNNFEHLHHAFFLADIFPSDENIYKFCSTCCKIVKGGKIPTICLINGLHFPEIPNELKDLTSLEERFVAPRIPFMRIVSLGYNRQCAIRGAVVNVPIQLDKTVNVLPRRFDQTEVIQVHLKRRLEYNHSFMTETIRPRIIIGAVQYLVNTDLYRKHNITISDDWLDTVGQNDEIPFISNMEDRTIVERLITDDTDVNVPEEANPQETLLENIPVENIPLQRICIAPGEGQRPLDMLFDEDSEELSYPTIYCGVKRTCTATVGKIIKSEARRYDRRCARVDKILYSYKKLELSRIKNSISTCLRKKVGSNRHTAGNMLDENFIQNLVQHDEGYHILKGIRSSPAHWEGEKKKVLAMIRQFGLPTFFITLSAAESQWPELLVILAKVIQNRIITEEEAMSLTTLEKYNLIRTDPITCSRYFDQRIRHLFKHFKAAGGIFDQHKVIKFYWRIEFQQRGSPHVHGIYWMDNAPIFNINDQTTFPEVVSFIDAFITTDSTIMELANYVSYQRHNHNRTCQREIRGQKICRFHIPYPPLPNTEILVPLPDDIDKNLLEKHQRNYEKIHNALNANLSDEDVNIFSTFQTFLADERINLTYEDYIFALRSSLKKPRVFLKRAFKDRCINAFNAKILSMQRANMDIQYVLDAYACVSYIVNYINKSNRGVSRLLQETMNEIRTGNFSVKQRLQHIGNKFISASEVSAQEASYNILGMHLSQCSNAEVFVNTLPPEKRVRILKPRSELQDLPEDSTNVFQNNILDHYIQRPDIINDVCLAYFAAYYTYSKKLRRNTRFQEEEDDYQEEDININEVGIPLQLKNNSGYIYKRRNAAIIRFPKFSVEITREEYFRNLIMLYLPWRDEQIEVLNNNNEQTCSTHKNIIESNRILFERLKEGELDEILQRFHQEANEDMLGDNLATTQILDDEFRALAVPGVDENINILNITGGNRRNDDDENTTDIRIIRLPPLINRNDLLASVRTLNVKQREYLHHLLRNVVDNIKFCEFISGGAGVGKSRLIKTIYQSVTQRFNSVPGSNPDLVKVLLSAPTGKAAFGIGGATLHSLFSLPVNQYSGEIRPLSNDVVNSLYARFMDLKVLIIDEISMVGARMLNYLDARLKQIFKSTTAFGGISILVFGDLKQLPPVGDKWIFSINTSNPYGVIAGESLWSIFKFFELTEIMRQRDDCSFAHALNSLAIGEMDETHINLIKSRIVQNTTILPSEAIHLFWSNAEAEHYNLLRLQQICTNEYSSKSFDFIKSDTLPIEQRNRILNMVSKMKTSETQGLCGELKLKSTAKYMMTVNINTSDGLVNGAAGVLMDVEINIQTGNPTTIWVLFSEENVGVEARRQKPHVTELTWTPVEKCVRTFQFKSNDNITIERTQFPLVIAEGITIHKSQGATYSKVVVHTHNRMNRSALYVACSRATCASGLHIIGNFNPPRPLKTSDPVKIELERLRSERVRTNFDFMSNNGLRKLYYQNIQSLQAHHEDISTDPTIMRANIICFVETWSFPEEDNMLTNFTVLSRLHCNNIAQGELRQRHKKGVIVYIGNNKIEDAEYLFEEEHCINGFPQIEFITLIRQAIYKLRNRIGNTTEKVYIIGDFNICRKTEEIEAEHFLNDEGYFSIFDKVIETTKHGTHIDWLFSTMDANNSIAKIYPTIHSYHDGILLGIE
ncbi:uncharacterized protein LOC135950582 [Calliphora vicina]|uniref:uncharacterized protein LOC135950582 n=1 Tax=Calliphora vicina TaxID=7373 RepID=UPI00325AE66E